MNTFILLFTIIANSHGYTPSVESLFRNGANAEVESNTIVANISVKKMDVALVNDPTRTEERPDSSQFKNFQQGYFKLLYSIHDRSRNINLTQVGYTGQDMKPEEIRDVKFLNGLNNSNLQKGVEGTEKGLFYALLNSLLLNDGEMIIQFLRSRGVSVRFNKEIINKPKVKLLEKYKDYLKLTNGNKDSGIASPLAPVNEEERLKVRAIVKEPFFKDGAIVKRVKEKEKFYWKIDTDNFTAHFTNEKRSLDKLEFQTTWGNILVNCKDYILFDGSHEFPKYIYFKDLTGIYYQVELLSLKQFTSHGDSLDKTIEKYQEAYKENMKANQDLFFKPSFIL